MRFGLLISTLLHASLVLLAAFGLPHLADPLVVKEQPLLVELVEIADVTTPQAPPTPDETPAENEADKSAEPEKAEEAKELAPPDVAPPPPMPQLAMAVPPSRPEVEQPAPPPPAPKVAVPPPPPPPLPKLEKKPPEAPKPPKLAMAPPPKPAPKPAPRPPAPAPKPIKAAAPPPPVPKVPKRPMPKPKNKPEPPKKEFNLNRIAALLDKSDKKRSPTPPKETTAKRSVQSVGRTAYAGGRQAAKLTMTEIDAIRLQIQRCWSVPAGARDAEDLVVRIKIFLNPDGSLARPPQIVDQSLFKQAGGEFYRTAAESARRAVLRCSPLKKLPLEKYDQWREVTLRFNPKDMLQ